MHPMEVAPSTSGGDSPEDHARLRDIYIRLRQRGVVAVMSNADVPPVRDLYDRLSLDRVRAARSVNSKADRRGMVGEVLAVGIRRVPIPLRKVAGPHGGSPGLWTERSR